MEELYLFKLYDGKGEYQEFIGTEKEYREYYGQLPYITKELYGETETIEGVEFYESQTLDRTFEEVIQQAKPLIFGGCVIGFSVIVLNVTLLVLIIKALLKYIRGGK